uniref:non-specific serine/threonine protein kinase n=1 Tax=viral metagenome TaxID=1070528 RepID=A0A6C0DKW2_9ZZZZ
MNDDNHIPILKVSLTGPGAKLVGQGTFGKVFSLDENTVYKRIKIITENEDEFSIIENNLRELSFYKLLMNKQSFTSSIILPEIPSSIPIPSKITFIEPYSYIQMNNYGQPLHNIYYKEKDTFKHIFKQIIEGVYALYKSNMTHGDLKPSNILVDKNNNVKIIDYGSVCFYHSKYLKNPFQRCTIFYTSPEELIYEKYSIYNDWWSLGVIMYEFCTRKCFIESLLNYLKINKSQIEKFLDYAYTKNTDLLDDARDFIVIFYSTLKEVDINNFIMHTIKDKEIQLYLIHLLKVEADERNVQEIIKLFNCTIPSVKEIKVSSTITEFNTLEIPSLNPDIRAKCIETIFTVAYQVKEFGEEIIGHSLMLFDRFFLRTKSDVEIYDPNIYCIIAMFVSSLILKGELIKGSYIKKLLEINSKKEYYLEDIRTYVLTFIEKLDFKLFNYSPDVLYNFTKDYFKLLEISLKYPFINSNGYQLFKYLK